MDEVTTRVLVAIEDRLFSILRLDTWERVIYYHLLRHTRVVGQRSVVFALASTGVATSMSETKVREVVRSLDRKGCVRITERGKSGHSVEVLLPDEIASVREAAPVEQVVDLDSLDFYTDRKYLAALMRRDSGECFYCGRIVTETTAVLDHVVSQMDGGDNSHRNVVTACHECNSLKQAEVAEEFLRRLYRMSVLSPADLGTRTQRLRDLVEGRLPVVIV